MTDVERVLARSDAGGTVPTVKPLLAPAARLDRPLHGIGFVLVAASVFPMQDVIIKGLSGRYPALQIVFVRSLIALSLYAWLLWRERDATTFPPGGRGCTPGEARWDSCRSRATTWPSRPCPSPP